MAAAGNLKALAGRIVDDDPLAYKELFLLYHPRLLQFSFSITHSKEVAEELVSDVFLKIWLRRKSLSDIDNLHLYLYVSTKNLSINWVLKQRRERTFQLDDIVVEFKSFHSDPEQMLISSEMFRRIQFAIQQLHPRSQLIFKLVKEDGLKYKQVAALLDLSIKTIENQMGIALRKIALCVQFDMAKTISPH